MPIPDFIVALRRQVGTTPLWLSGVTAVVEHEGRVLLVQRSDTAEWTPVTGIIDPGEHPAVTARREVFEEAGVHVSVERLALIGVTEPIEYGNGDRAQYLDHTFHCRYLGGEPYPADDESLDARWFALDALPAISAHFRERIDAALSGESATRFIR